MNLAELLGFQFTDQVQRYNVGYESDSGKTLNENRLPEAGPFLKEDYVAEHLSCSHASYVHQAS
jgi:hypothetical protein